MYPIQNVISTLLVLTIAVIIFSDKGSAMWTPCKPCATVEECNQQPIDCIYGENLNYCERRVCSKGPGEKCSNDQYRLLGTCGEGMWCSSKDNRCHGCYIPTLQCME